jgi:hypothetical protein
MQDSPYVQRSKLTIKITIAAFNEFSAESSTLSTAKNIDIVNMQNDQCIWIGTSFATIQGSVGENYDYEFFYVTRMIARRMRENINIEQIWKEQDYGR